MRAGLTPRVAATLCAVVATVGAFAGGEPGSPPVDHARFDAVLRDSVRGEGVDYARVRQRHLQGLGDYLDGLARVDVSALPRDEQLAFYINLYNASVIRAVAERYEPGYRVDRDGFALFEEPLAGLSGERVSLNRLEHEIIRPAFADPRVHAALVCAARSCPPLVSRAFVARDLDSDLEAGMIRFVRDGSRNTIDIASRRLELSKIFEWYAVDFGGLAQLARYIGRYAEPDVAGFSVGFREYSWELNLAPEADP